ncbi:hypothetical protein KIN20_030736 [Parelaphostrongylus tenuis]|uniref:Uncharacterized protein n=1 Tax=Parelaphostrongylus tenuis TaxID=148309 RepID=A0AAD5R4K7_PARTN|nr:hypothetical protein KIN20_030736 [Parelaphostrongylus tenuis]
MFHLTIIEHHNKATLETERQRAHSPTPDRACTSTKIILDSSTQLWTNPPHSLVKISHIENTPRAEPRTWLSFSTRTPTDSDDDGLDVLPPEAEESSSDDEYEPVVEECLLNRAELPLKTVNRLTEQAKKLGKLIRTRNRLQQQYCINRENPQLNDEYRLCPIWRNEKKVHNYQLMRIKYCADYSKWPNASKLMSTYGDNLNLYETLYAFQKP